MVDAMPSRYANPDILLLYPREKLSNPPGAAVPDGYRLRVLREGEEDARAWIRIHCRAVPSWSAEKMRGHFDPYLRLALPGGVFMIEHVDSGEAVATAGTIHHTRDGQIPFGGQLAWVATDPAHQHRGLATAASAAATRCLIERGYRNIVVCTGDDLIAAISIYLRLGYLPFLYEEGMAERWRDIARQIERLEFTPEQWLKEIPA